MPQYFLSYRSTDAVYAVQVISDRMAHYLGRENIFRDQDSFGLGVDFARVLEDALRTCHTMVVVIGPHWLTEPDGHGGRRLDHPDDWVRTEIRTALVRDITVIPVILDSTTPPAADELPADIRALAGKQCWYIRHQTLLADVHGLIARLDPRIGDRMHDNDHPSDRPKFDVSGDHNNVLDVRGRGHNIHIGDKLVQRRRWWRFYLLAGFLVADVAYFYYGASAYTGTADNSDDLSRALIFLALIGVTVALLRGLFRR